MEDYALSKRNVRGNKMDWSWLQPISYLIAIGVFIWHLRKDSKEDYIRMEHKLESWRAESNAMITAIREDMKDFHGRLCAIEERNKNK
jgi:hypothetical protein